MGHRDDGDNIVWGTADDGDNIVWGTADDGDNIVWGTADDGDNIVWGDRERDEHRVADLPRGASSHGKDALPRRTADTAMVMSDARDPTTVVSTDWQQALPALRGRQVVLRELRASDAPSLFALLTTEEVSRFISPPPTHGRRLRALHRVDAPPARGRHVRLLRGDAWHGFDTAIGIFQVRATEPGFGTAEWGFAIGSAFWGTGVFQEGAELVLDFAFETHRRAPAGSARGGRRTAAATARCRSSAPCRNACCASRSCKNGEYLDQVLYAMLDTDWRGSRRADRRFARSCACTRPFQSLAAQGAGVRCSSSWAGHMPALFESLRSPQGGRPPCAGGRLSFLTRSADHERIIERSHDPRGVRPPSA